MLDDSCALGILTLDEAIQHCIEVVDNWTEEKGCVECLNQHKQLRDWLLELKNARETGYNNPVGINKEYGK